MGECGAHDYVCSAPSERHVIVKRFMAPLWALLPSQQLCKSWSACWAGDIMFLYGGHTVAVDPSDKSETETVHDDMWALDLLTHQVGGFQACHGLQHDLFSANGAAWTSRQLDRNGQGPCGRLTMFWRLLLRSLGTCLCMNPLLRSFELP